MKQGGGKGKGTAFERDICKTLSLWVTHGEKTDVFWRSAMSGGRATVAKKKGQDVRQAGDITAVAPEGHSLTDRYFIECKYYANLNLDAFILESRGNLLKFWQKTVAQAMTHNRRPLLIARQNRRPTIALLNSDHGRTKTKLFKLNPICTAYGVIGEDVHMYLFKDLVTTEYKA